MIYSGSEPPWEGICEYHEDGLVCDYGRWVEIESCWDGMRRWRYVEGGRITGFSDLMKRLKIAQIAHTAWLDDVFLFGGRGIEVPSERRGFHEPDRD